VTLRKDQPGPVTAAEIDLPHDVEVVNPEHVIAYLTQGGKIDMQIKIERGRGYVPGSWGAVNPMVLAVLRPDASFSPVRRVKLCG
jgi:DNA-directed RNA polymerase subunit alpha